MVQANGAQGSSGMRHHFLLRATDSSIHMVDCPHSAPAYRHSQYYTVSVTRFVKVQQRTHRNAGLYVLLALLMINRDEARARLHRDKIRFQGSEVSNCKAQAFIPCKLWPP